MQARDMKRVEDGNNRPSADAAASRCPAHGGHAGDPKRETLRCGCPDVGKTANLTQPGEQSNRAQKDNQSAMSQLLDAGKPPRKRSGRRKRKPPSYRDCPPETGSSRGQGRKSSDRPSKKETPIQSGRRESTLVSYCGLERKHPLSREDTPQLTTPAKSCGNGAPHSRNIDDKTNHSRSKRDSLTPDKDARDRRFVSNTEDLSHEKIGNECRPHLQLSSRQGRIFKMSIEGLLEQSPSPPPGSSDRRSRTSSCSEDLFDFSSSRSRTGTKAEFHDDGNLLSSSREHQSSSSQENIKSANKGTRPHEDVSKASPTVESLEEKLGKLKLTETADRREPEKDNMEVVEGEADSRTELLPRQTKTNTSSRKSIPSKGFIYSRSTDTSSQSQSYEKPTSATKSHKVGTSLVWKSSSQTETSPSYSTKNTPVKEPCDNATPSPARLSEKTSQQERRTTLKSCSNETYVHNDTHTYSPSRWAYLNKSTAQVKHIPPSNSNKSHANTGSDSSVNKTSRTDFKKHASFKEVHCQKTSSDKSSNNGKSAVSQSCTTSICAADKHVALTVHSGHGETKVRPSEKQMRQKETEVRPDKTTVRQGDTKLPGATKVRPAQSMVQQAKTKVRPVETKVRPGETKVRPGDTKVRPGDMKVRPREPKLQQGETNVRPGETKGRPGDTKVQPGNIKVRPRDARVQPGEGTSSNKNKVTSNTVMNVLNKNGKLQGTEGSGPTRSQAVKGRQASGDSSNSQRRAGGRKSRSSRRNKGRSRSRNEGRQKTPLEEEQPVGVTTTTVNTVKRDFALATEKTGTDERTTQPLVKGVQRESVGKSSRTPQVQQTSATMEKPAENTASFREGGLALCEEKTLVSSQCPNKPASEKPRGYVQRQVQGTTQGQVHMISNNVSSENCIPCSEDWGSPPRINTSCPGPRDNSTSNESKEEDGVTHFLNLIDSDPMSNREPSSESDINCKEPFSNLSASAVSVNTGFENSNDKQNNELLLEKGPSPSEQGQEEACKTKHRPRRLSTPRTSPNPPSPSPCCPHQPNCSHSGQRSHRVFSPPARRKSRQNGLAVGPGDVTSLRDSSHEAEMQDPGYTLQDSTKRESVPQRERRRSTPHKQPVQQMPASRRSYPFSPTEGYVNYQSLVVNIPPPPDVPTSRIEPVQCTSPSDNVEAVSKMIKRKRQSSYDTYTTAKKRESSPNGSAEMTAQHHERSTRHKQYGEYECYTSYSSSDLPEQNSRDRMPEEPLLQKQRNPGHSGRSVEGEPRMVEQYDYHHGLDGKDDAIEFRAPFPWECHEHFSPLSRDTPSPRHCENPLMTQEHRSCHGDWPATMKPSFRGLSGDPPIELDSERRFMSPSDVAEKPDSREYNPPVPIASSEGRPNPKQEMQQEPSPSRDDMELDLNLQRHGVRKLRPYLEDRHSPKDVDNAYQEPHGNLHGGHLKPKETEKSNGKDHIFSEEHSNQMDHSVKSGSHHVGIRPRQLQYYQDDHRSIRDSHPEHNDPHRSFSAPAVSFRDRPDNSHRQEYMHRSRGRSQRPPRFAARRARLEKRFIEPRGRRPHWGRSERNSGHSHEDEMQFSHNRDYRRPHSRGYNRGGRAMFPRQQERKLRGQILDRRFLGNQTHSILKIPGGPQVHEQRFQSWNPDEDHSSQSCCNYVDLRERRQDAIGESDSYGDSEHYRQHANDEPTNYEVAGQHARYASGKAGHFVETKDTRQYATGEAHNYAVSGEHRQHATGKPSYFVEPQEHRQFATSEPTTYTVPCHQIVSNDNDQSQGTEQYPAASISSSQRQVFCTVQREPNWCEEAELPSSSSACEESTLDDEIDIYAQSLGLSPLNSNSVEQDNLENSDDEDCGLDYSFAIEAARLLFSPVASPKCATQKGEDRNSQQRRVTASVPKAVYHRADPRPLSVTKTIGTPTFKLIRFTEETQDGKPTQPQYPKSRHGSVSRRSLQMLPAMDRVSTQIGSAEKKVQTSSCTQGCVIIPLAIEEQDEQLNDFPSVETMGDAPTEKPEMDRDTEKASRKVLFKEKKMEEAPESGDILAEHSTRSSHEVRLVITGKGVGQIKTIPLEPLDSDAYETGEEECESNCSKEECDSDCSKEGSESDCSKEGGESDCSKEGGESDCSKEGGESDCTKEECESNCSDCSEDDSYHSLDTRIVSLKTSERIVTSSGEDSSQPSQKSMEIRLLDEKENVTAEMEQAENSTNESEEFYIKTNEGGEEESLSDNDESASSASVELSDESDEEYDWFDNPPPEGKDVTKNKEPKQSPFQSKTSSASNIQKPKKGTQKKRTSLMGIGPMLDRVRALSSKDPTWTSGNSGDKQSLKRFFPNPLSVLSPRDGSAGYGPSEPESVTPTLTIQRRKSRWSDPISTEDKAEADAMWKQRFKERYGSLQTPFIDTHCHLDFLFKRNNFNGSYEKYRNMNEMTFPPCYSGCVAVFCDPRTFKNEGMWKDLLQEPGVWGAVGCHPKSATYFDRAAEKTMLKMLAHKKIVALGEIGLDYSGTFQQHEDVQKKVFRQQIQLALEIKLPLVIHCRDAEEDCLEILTELVPRNHKIHRHCFTGSWDEAQTWLRHFPNSFIGLTPLVTYARGPREVAKKIPLDRLLLETDAPYFIPRSVPRDNMECSHPGMAVTVAGEVAQIKGISIEEVLKQCLQNTEGMYGIRPPSN